MSEEFIATICLTSLIVGFELFVDYTLLNNHSEETACKAASVVSIVFALLTLAHFAISNYLNSFVSKSFLIVIIGTLIDIVLSIVCLVLNNGEDKEEENYTIADLCLSVLRIGLVYSENYFTKKNGPNLLS